MTKEGLGGPGDGLWFTTAMPWGRFPSGHDLGGPTCHDLILVLTPKTNVWYYVKNGRTGTRKNGS